MQSCVDTVPGGPFLVGPTFGCIYEIGSSFDFIVAVNSALGVPNFTFNLDINAGVGFRDLVLPAARGRLGWRLVYGTPVLLFQRGQGRVSYGTRERPKRGRRGRR